MSQGQINVPETNECPRDNSFWMYRVIFGCLIGVIEVTLSIPFHSPENITVAYNSFKSLEYVSMV